MYLVLSNSCGKFGVVRLVLSVVHEYQACTVYYSDKGQTVTEPHLVEWNLEVSVGLVGDDKLHIYFPETDYISHFRQNNPQKRIKNSLPTQVCQTRPAKLILSHLLLLDLFCT